MLIVTHTSRQLLKNLEDLAVENPTYLLSLHTNYSNWIISCLLIYLEDTSESFGLQQTVDFMFALISNDELEQAGSDDGQTTKE